MARPRRGRGQAPGGGARGCQSRGRRRSSRGCSLAMVPGICQRRHPPPTARASRIASCLTGPRRAGKAGWPRCRAIAPPIPRASFRRAGAPSGLMSAQLLPERPGGGPGGRDVNPPQTPSPLTACSGGPGAALRILGQGLIARPPHPEPITQSHI